MPKYLIERDMPGVGQLSPRELQALAQRCRTGVAQVGHRVQWVETFVTDDRLYSIYIASSAAAVQEHAQQAGLPANRVSEIRTTIDPTTAETLPEIAG